MGVTVIALRTGGIRRPPGAQIIEAVLSGASFLASWLLKRINRHQRCSQVSRLHPKGGDHESGRPGRDPISGDLLGFALIVKTARNTHIVLRLLHRQRRKGKRSAKASFHLLVSSLLHIGLHHRFQALRSIQLWTSGRHKPHDRQGLAVAACSLCHLSTRGLFGTQDLRGPDAFRRQIWQTKQEERRAAGHQGPMQQPGRIS